MVPTYEKRRGVWAKESDGGGGAGRRSRGRPKRRWMDCVREDLREKQLSEDDVHDRAWWRRAVKIIDPT